MGGIVRALGLGVLLLGLTAPVLAAPRQVEVRIMERWAEQKAEVRVPPHLASYPLRAQGGRIRVEARGNALWVNGTRLPDPELRLGQPTESSSFEIRASSRQRKYPGLLRMRAERGNLVLFNVLPLESYVVGVVSAEMPERWPVAALRAQAVLARTLGLRGGDHPGGKLCDLTHCQVYGGERNSEASLAAQETRGQVLTYQGALIQPLYHSTCGGERVSNATIFEGAALPYLQEGSDPYCEASPHAAPWSVRVLGSELARALKVNRVQRVEVTDRSPGGWVARVAIDGRPMSGYRFWQAVGQDLGWGILKSMRFSVSRSGDAVLFTGKGLGHGVGLCQWGAKGQAEKGIPYARILASYYPGTALARR